MADKNQPLGYVRHDAGMAVEHASDGFVDFGSLDGLEAAVGRAEMATVRPNVAVAWSRAAGREFPVAAAALGRGVAASGADAAPAMSRRRFDVALRAGSGLHGRVAHLPNRGDEAKLAELAKVQQRHTRMLEKIMELVRGRRGKALDAGGNQPFVFGP